LAIDENGIFYNGQHKIGYAYRPGSGSEDTEQTFPDEVLNDFVYVNGSLTDRSLTGALYVLRSDLKKDSTLTTTSLSADDSVQDNLSVLDRGLVRDNRYGDLPVEGSDETDFYFSSYQNRLNFEFRTTWEEIEGVSQGTYDRVYKWLSFWVNYYKDSTNVDLLSQIATSFDASLSIETMPTTFRPEMQIYADIVYYTGLADIQSFLNDNSRRCFGQDYVVKTPGVNAVSLAISVSRDANFLRYREESFKTKIADYISSKGLSHTTPITTEHIKSLIFDEGPSTVNDKFTMLVTTSVVKKDGTTESVTRDYLDYLEDPDLGITPRNSVFVCSSKNITISYE